MEDWPTQYWHVSTSSSSGEIQKKNHFGIFPSLVFNICQIYWKLLPRKHFKQWRKYWHVSFSSSSGRSQKNTPSNFSQNGHWYMRHIDFLFVTPERIKTFILENLKKYGEYKLLFGKYFEGRRISKLLLGNCFQEFWDKLGWGPYTQLENVKSKLSFKTLRSLWKG